MCAALLLAVDDKYLHLLLKNILHPRSDRWREGVWPLVLHTLTADAFYTMQQEKEERGRPRETGRNGEGQHLLFSDLLSQCSGFTDFR